MYRLLTCLPLLVALTPIGCSWGENGNTYTYRVEGEAESARITFAIPQQYDSLVASPLPFQHSVSAHPGDTLYLSVLAADTITARIEGASLNDTQRGTSVVMRAVVPE